MIGSDKSETIRIYPKTSISSWVIKIRIMLYLISTIIPAVWLTAAVPGWTWGCLHVHIGCIINQTVMHRCTHRGGCGSITIILNFYLYTVQILQHKIWCVIQWFYLPNLIFAMRVYRYFYFFQKDLLKMSTCFSSL